MGTPRILGVDCGLTGTKAVVFDTEGRILSLARRTTPTRNRGGRSEIDMTEQWLMTAEAIREAVRTAGSYASDILCLGVSGHGAGLYTVDAAHEPFMPAFTSMDTRASGIIGGWKEAGVSAYPLTRHQPWAGQPVAQLAWLKDCAPEDYKRIQSVLSAKSWVTLRLTGELTADYTDSSNAGFVNLEGSRYDQAILDTYGIPEAANWLPKLFGSTEVVGSVSPEAAEQTGLAAGTPVAAGMFDVVACAVGSGVSTEDRFSLVAGTWNINTAFDTVLKDAVDSVKCSLGLDCDRFTYVESSATSASNLEWFVSAFLGDRPRKTAYDAVSEAAQTLKPEVDDPFFLPFLHDSHLGTGGARFIGLRPEHGFAHAARAVLEGVCFAHRTHIDNLASSGIRRESAVLCGGAARDSYWCSLFADCLGMPVAVAEGEEVGALGAALAAAVAAGLYPSVEAASSAMIRIARSYEPNPSLREVTDARYHRRFSVDRCLNSG